MTIYRGRCPKCGATLEARPHRRVWNDLWRELDRLFKHLDHVFRHVNTRLRSGGA